jgi:ADP-ribosylglycohydrolase/fructose-1,6-bisphosphatase/inositol monophosphatase family enzyme
MSYAAALRLAIEAALAAGAVLLGEMHRPGGPRGGGDKAPADTEVELAIRAALLAATPYGYLGEETDDEVIGVDPSHVWIVDPNDGTAAFLKGRRGASVSIALVRGGVPVLGVVYAYAYPDDDGDLIAWAEGTGAVTRHGVAVEHRLDQGTLAHGAIVIVSQDADERSAANARCVAPARFLAMPSIAYRLALVAVGDGVAGVSLAGSRSWDYAAGHALVRGAGGDLIDQQGRVVTYDVRGRSSAARCFGGALGVVQELARRPWDDVRRNPTTGAPAPYPLCRAVPGRHERDAGRLRRAQGCWLGQLAGDALGSLVEFKSAAAIATLYPGGVRDLADGGEWDTIAGQPTDDSEMALMLARTLVRDGQFDRAAALDGYVHWHDSDPFDMGGTTRAALQAASRAEAREERLARAAASAKQESQANGSLMRIAPLAIFGASDPAAAAGWAREDSALTHPHVVCREACAAFVAAIAFAIQTGNGPETTYAAGLAEARRGGNEAVIATIERARHELPSSFTHHEGWVLVALQNAFYRLLNAATFEEGVIGTVMAGGDTDTNGAIAGALLGAVHGREGVPRRYREQVITCRPLREIGALQPRPREFWPVDAMVLAEALLLAGAAAG